MLQKSKQIILKTILILVKKKKKKCVLLQREESHWGTRQKFVSALLFYFQYLLNLSVDFTLR